MHQAQVQSRNESEIHNEKSKVINDICLSFDAIESFPMISIMLINCHQYIPVVSNGEETYSPFPVVGHQLTAVRALTAKKTSHQPGKFCSKRACFIFMD